MSGRGSPLAGWRMLRVVALSVGAASCAPTPPDLAAEQQRLLRRDQEWSQLAAAGKDVEKTASYWADDAVIIPPGQPAIEGKAAIRAFVAAAFHTPGFSIRWTSQKPAFSPDGQLAYMRGTNLVTVPGRDGTLVTTTGQAMTVWRREADGQWRCVVDMWSDSPSSVSAQPATP